MKPFVEHLADLDAAVRRVYPPDPGKTARVFIYDDDRKYWVTMATPPAIREGFLNWHDKLEFLRIGDGPPKLIRRADMTAAEFAAIPVEP